MNSRAMKFKMSVKTPNALFFNWSSFEMPEPDTPEVSMRRTSFIIRPQMQVNRSTDRELAQKKIKNKKKGLVGISNAH